CSSRPSTRAARTSGSSARRNRLTLSEQSGAYPLLFARGLTAMPETEDTYERKVHVVAGPITLEASLSLPEGANRLVLFAHGRGSSRFSPRNRYVARMLNEARIATLLLDLLTAGEEETDLRTGRLRFDITLLADRLIGATDWIRQQPETRALRVGYFG